MLPKFITFTGIDVRTSAMRVRDLSAAYPVEWGILFSERNQGRANRYPSLREISKFLSDTDGAESLHLSAHICGRYSRDIFSGEGMPENMVRYLGNARFSRTQINIADGETDVEEAAVRSERAAAFARSILADKAIIQCRGNFPDDPTVDWLFDKSGGAGELPDNGYYAGAAYSTAFCGYAGGIGPDNITRVLDLIRQVHVPEKEFWIDMENNVRTGDWLDLDKCEAVLKAVYG